MQTIRKNKRGFVTLAAWRFLDPRAFVILLIIVVVIIYGSATASVISIGGKALPVQTGEVSLGDYTGTYETLYVGSIGSGGVEPDTRVAIDGGNDAGDSSLSNSIAGGDYLLLTSSKSNGGSSSKSENFMRVKIMLPAGTITTRCDLSSGSGRLDLAFADCGVSGKYNGRACWSGNTFQPPCANDGNRKGQGDTLQEAKIFVLDEPEEVEFYVKSRIEANTGRATARMRVEFIPDPDKLPVNNGEEPSSQTDSSPSGTGTPQTQELNIFERFWNFLKGLFS